MKGKVEKEISFQKDKFSQKLYMALMMCGGALLIAGLISSWFWHGMFGITFGEGGLAGQVSEPGIIAEYAALKPLINLVMYVVPWGFYALGGGALMAGLTGCLVEYAYDVVRNIFGKNEGERNISQ
ncbi:hypothetical protein OJ723_001202 [Salmonella enterica]|uniref:hypothetical protein n=1 Tax=Escherichia coli TaxID=562 RepID=UPI000B7F332E|nr:hypothetical protein [Escherichia coli]EGC2886753.1 hypothetical protein [Salmonella enterica subsp. enterica serovar Give]EKA1665423.1 hypothetical protein [Salmonella enterica]